MYFGLLVISECFFFAMGFLIFGILHLVAFEKALPIYRFWIGKKRYQLHGDRIAAMTTSQRNVMGVTYTAFALLLIWKLTRTLLH